MSKLLCRHPSCWVPFILSYGLCRCWRVSRVWLVKNLDNLSNCYFRQSLFTWNREDDLETCPFSAILSGPIFKVLWSQKKKKNLHVQTTKLLKKTAKSKTLQLLQCRMLWGSNEPELVSCWEAAVYNAVFQAHLETDILAGL